jgi:uncharacterized protein YqjF (DUF2071 family)
VDTRAFLTAEWRYLAMLNYAVEPHLVQPFVPPGVEIDYHEGRTFISLVGFQFLSARVRGIPIPFHMNFEEVNLRLYVRRRERNEVRRGVVFIREIVPRYAIAAVARRVYGENYVSLPMSHRIVRRGGTDREGLGVEYSWRCDGKENRMSIDATGLPKLPAEGSLDQFIAEHYWGYTARGGGSQPAASRLSGTLACFEYRVEHEPWRVWHVREARFEGDPSSLYGAQFAGVLERPPDSAFLAEGSSIAVYSATRKQAAS